MKKILMIIMLCITVCIAKAQTVGELYQQYKTAVEAGNMEKAFEAIKACDSQTSSCPFASAALAVMYNQGYGTTADPTNALVSFLSCQFYDKTKKLSKDREINSVIANTANSLGLNLTLDGLNETERKNQQNYEQYMMLDEVNHACVIAFACRMHAIADMQGYDESKASGDTEEMLADVEAAVEACLAADSIASDAYAHYLLGKIYYEGLLGFKDKETGLALLTNAAEEDDCLSAKVYLAKLDIKKGDIKAAKEKLDDVIYMDVRPIKPLMMDECYMLIDPNYDHYDVRKCKQEAEELMKALGGEDD